MTYDPTRDLTKLKGKEYLEVKYRLLWLRDRDPDARITTELVTPPTADELVVRAEVTLTTGGCATAYGACGRSEFGDALEKAETKAIGRALGALGFGTQFAGTELDYGADDGRVVDAPMAPGSVSDAGAKIRESCRQRAAAAHPEIARGYRRASYLSC